MDAEQALPATGQFTGRQAFAQTVRAALACAAEQGWAELILSDADFADWPLNEPGVAQSLQAWARRGRRFTLLAADYDELRQRHPRFLAWRRTWDHLIDCRLAPGRSASAFPSVLWSPVWFMHRFDPLHCTLTCSTQTEAREDLRGVLDELLRDSRPGLPASILGL